MPILAGAFTILHKQFGENLALTNLYKIDGSNEQKFFSRVIALAFVPLQYVRLTRTGLPDSYAIPPHTPKIIDTWLDGQFSSTKRSVHGTDGPQTNKNLRGWHSNIRKQACKTHPSHVFKLVELDKLQQAAA